MKFLLSVVLTCLVCVGNTYAEPPHSTRVWGHNPDWYVNEFTGSALCAAVFKNTESYHSTYDMIKTYVQALIVQFNKEETQKAAAVEWFDTVADIRERIQAGAISNDTVEKYQCYCNAAVVIKSHHMGIAISAFRQSHPAE